MNSKKWVALLMTIVFALGILSGCSPAELRYNQLRDEIVNLQLHEDTGEISMVISEFPISELTEEEQFQLEVIQKTFEQYSLTYHSRIDMDKQIFDYSLSLKDKITGNEQELLTLIGEGNDLYIKVDQLINFIESFGNDEVNKELENAFGDAKYLFIDKDQLTQVLMSSSTSQESLVLQAQADMFDNYFDQYTKQQILYQKMINGFMTKVFDDYSTDLVKKSGNKYVLTLDAETAINLIEPTFIYLIDNADKWGAFLQDFINGLDDAELALLGLDRDTKMFVGPYIEEFVEDIKVNGDLYKEQLNFTDDPATQELISLMGDSKLTSSLEKKNSTTYQAETQVRLNIKDLEDPELNIDGTISATATFVKVKSFDISVPTEGVITLSELQARTAQVMKVKVEENKYSMKVGAKTSEGPMNVKVINYSTYLPMRQIAEAFSEEVGWDSYVGRAYVERGFSQIDMTGLTINGSTYVKIRDFEKLGYQIDWDEATKTVTITKNLI